MSDGDSFINQYLAYVGETESPMFYHRWCCLSMIGAYLGRQYHFKFGHFNISPNQYIMLIGVPAARKSTAIKLSKKIITLAGYDKISADKSSKEKFMLDLSGDDGSDAKDSSTRLEKLLEENLWGGNDSNATDAEMYIACDEFNDFIGIGNIEFISLLGNLWDYDGQFKNRIKTGKSVCINNPTINILGGNTPVSFATAFPSSILGQGFFSRLLLIYGEPTGKRITFPKIPSESSTQAVVKELQTLKYSSIGLASLEPVAELLLDKIYKSWGGMDDHRFESYANRRFTHLIKLCLIFSASEYSSIISERHVIQANTLLTYTEHLMPSALGEFGKSRNSDTTHKIMQLLGHTNKIMTLKDLWEHLHSDMEKVNDLGEILRNLTAADKIIAINGGFLGKRKVFEAVNSDVLDYSFLTNEERDGVL